MVTVRKTKAFIDVSRRRRCLANLRILEQYLGRDPEPDSDKLQQQSPYEPLSLLDRGLSDLVRIVRGRSGPGAARPVRSGRARGRTVSSSSKEATHG